MQDISAKRVKVEEFWFDWILTPDAFFHYVFSPSSHFVLPFTESPLRFIHLLIAGSGQGRALVNSQTHTLSWPKEA